MSRRLLSERSSSLSQAPHGVGVLLAFALAHWIAAVWFLTGYHSTPEAILGTSAQHAIARRAAALGSVRDAIRTQNFGPFGPSRERSRPQYAATPVAILDVLPEVANVPDDLSNRPATGGDDAVTVEKGELAEIRGRHEAIIRASRATSRDLRNASAGRIKLAESQRALHELSRRR